VHTPPPPTRCVRPQRWRTPRLTPERHFNDGLPRRVGRRSYYAEVCIVLQDEVRSGGSYTDGRFETQSATNSSGVRIMTQLVAILAPPCWAAASDALGRTAQAGVRRLDDATGVRVLAREDNAQGLRSGLRYLCPAPNRRDRARPDRR